MQGGHLLGNAILFFLVLLPVTRAALRNITIDDAQGDEVTGAKPIYTPPNQWYAISSQSRCDGICDPNPGIDEAYFSTWHVATGFPTEPSRIEFKFNGSAVFIYCILAGNARPNSQTHLSLLVDGVEMDTFHWIPTNNTPPFYYQVPVLSASALESRTHFVVVLSAVTAIDYSVIFFDFAVYSVEESEAQSPAPGGGDGLSTGEKIGIGISAGSAGVGAIYGGIKLYFWVKKNRK